MSDQKKEEPVSPEPVSKEASVTDQAPVEPKTETEPAGLAPAVGEVGGEGEEEVEVVEEKTYTIPIGKLGYTTDRGHRAPRAVRDVRKYVSRHMRSDEVSISNEINSSIWAAGINKPPRKIVVRAVKDKEGRVVVYPAKT